MRRFIAIREHDWWAVECGAIVAVTLSIWVELTGDWHASLAGGWIFDPLIWAFSPILLGLCMMLAGSGVVL